MKSQKLVRDGIPEIIRKRGAEPVTHIATEDEYRQELKAKLREETEEFMKEPNKEELADILEVIYALCDLYNIDRKDLELLRIEKAESRGSFKDRIILEKTIEKEKEN